MSNIAIETPEEREVFQQMPVYDVTIHSRLPSGPCIVQTADGSKVIHDPERPDRTRLLLGMPEKKL
jgi:hypothetical protein